MVGILTLDTHLVITHWNDWLSDFTGRSAREVIGRQLAEVFPGLEERGILRALRHTLETGAPLRVSHELHKYIFPPRQGEPQPQTGMIQPILKEGEVSGLLFIVRDVSERTWLESELRRRIEHLEALHEVDQLVLGEGLDEVLEAIGRWAQKMFSALWVDIFTLEQGHLIPRVLVGDPPAREKPRVYALGEGLIGKVAASGEPLRVLDVTQEAEYIEVDPRVRAEVIVPIRVEGEVWGVLNLQSDTPSEFAGDTVQILQSLADQVALAVQREQSRLQERRRSEALTLLREFGVRLTEAADLQAVYELGVRFAVRLLDASSAQLFLYDSHADKGKETGLTFVAGPGIPGIPRQIIAQPRPEGLTHSVARSGQPIVVNDPASHPLYGREHAREWEFKAIMGLPLKRGGVVMGVLTVSFAYRREFTSEDQHYLSLLVEQLAGVIESARLREEETRRLAELEAVSRISSALRASESLKEMLPILLDETLAVLNASTGSILLYNPVTNLLEETVNRGWFSSLPTRSVKPGEGIAGNVFRRGEMHLSREFFSDALTLEAARPGIPPGWGGVCLPLRTAVEVVGVLFVAVELPRELRAHEVKLLTTLAEIAGNAIHRSRLHEQTLRRLDFLHALRAVEQAISSSFDTYIILEIVADQVVSRLRVDAATVLLYHPELNQLKLASSRGFLAPLSSAVNLSLGESLAGQVIRERSRVSVPNLVATGYRGLFHQMRGEGFVAYHGVPMITKGKIVGVVEAYHRSSLIVDQEWIDLFEALAVQAAVALENTRLFEELQYTNVELSLAYDATIAGWAKALELRDEVTEGHTLRVTDLTEALAREFNIPSEQIVHIRRGALLHDIGKMAIPDSILKKPGPLSEEEWVIMRKHPQYAYDMLHPIAFLRPALDIPLYHHERWDGSGYPHGLEGEQIPFSARLFAVADVFDALTSDRPYRSAWTQSKALAYIREQADIHFDPQVVNVFLKLIDL